MVLLAATFGAMRNSKTASDRASQPAVQPKPAPQQAQAPAKPGLLSAEDAVRAIVAPGSPVNSARFRVRVAGTELGGARRTQTSVLAGSFAPGASGAPVSFDVKGRDDTSGPVHLVSAAGKAYGLKGGKAYELSSTPKRVANARRVLSGGAGAGSLPSVDPAPWFKRLKVSAGPKLAGVATTHVSGIVNSKRVVRDVRRLVRSAGADGGAPARLPTGMGARLEKAFHGARLEADVGTSDKIVRQLRFSNRATGRERMAVDLSLAGVNKPQRIAPPASKAHSKLSKRETRSLDGAFITSAIALDPPAGLAQMGIAGLRVTAEARAQRIPRRVEAAIRAHKKVVLFIQQRNGVDDRPTAHAVASVRKRTKAAVFVDSIDNLAAYGQSVQDVGVTRSPSIVIIGRKGRARLVDGYIDPAALAQEVADTR